MALHKPPLGLKPKSEDNKEISRTRKEFFMRVLGGALVLLCIVGGIISGGAVWYLVCSAIALGSLWEFYRLIYTKYKISRGWGLAGGFLVLASVSAGLSYAITLSVLSLLAFIILFTEVARRQITGQSYALWNMGGTMAGLVYIVLPWSFMIVVRSQTWGHVFLLTLFFCTWSCDVGAYLVGSKIGETPFCSRVSPKKSWEGFAAGVVASTLCGGLLALYIFDFSLLPLMLLGLLCGVAGQLGDLAESVLKREARVKDTGSVIPGHGGLLDRFDSILINATLAFLILEVIG